MPRWISSGATIAGAPRPTSEGPLEGGRLAGDLILKGYGDPKITIEQWQAFMTDLRARGLEQVDGDLVLDRSYFRYRGARSGGVRPRAAAPVQRGTRRAAGELQVGALRVCAGREARRGGRPDGAAAARDHARWPARTRRRRVRRLAHVARRGDSRIRPPAPARRSPAATRRPATSATGTWRCSTILTTSPACSRRTSARPAGASRAD